MNKYRLRVLKRKIGWILKTNSVTRRLIRIYLRKKSSKNPNLLMNLINSADKVLVDNCDLKLGIIKDEDDLSLSFRAYWPLFVRFAKNNNITYSFLNIHGNNWIKESANFDLIVWRPLSDPGSLYEAKTKIAYIEEFHKIRCHPSSKELYLYEDKINQYYHLRRCNLPVIDTFISFDEQECRGRLDSFEYPLISKSYTGSSSISVSKIKNKDEARRHIFHVFSKGQNTGFPYFKQKGYVYFQKYIDDAVDDLRIILIGDKIFGYYRMRPQNDFRASGAGLVVKDELPLEAVLIALKVKENVISTMLAVDFLKSKKLETYFLNEISISIDISTPEQLMVKNVPGYYVLNNNSLEFHPGRFWLQELLLEELVRTTAGRQT
jgi:glutathione synthase/RimK-type ligase-like ATP-grasp enzyme